MIRPFAKPGVRQSLRRPLGWIPLAIGFVICGFFVAGLDWLFRLR